MKKFVIAMILTATLAGCASKPAAVVINTAPPIETPKTPPVEMRPVQWHVYTAAEVDAMEVEAQKNGQHVVLFSLDSSNFKNLMSNLIDIKQYIEAQNQVIGFLTSAHAVTAEQAKAVEKK